MEGTNSLPQMLSLDSLALLPSPLSACLPPFVHTCSRQPSALPAFPSLPSPMHMTGVSSGLDGFAAGCCLFLVLCVCTNKLPRNPSKHGLIGCVWLSFQNAPSVLWLHSIDNLQR